MTIPISEVLADLEAVSEGTLTLSGLIDSYQRRFHEALDEIAEDAPPYGMCKWCGVPLNPDVDPWYADGVCYECGLERD